MLQACCTRNLGPERGVVAGGDLVPIAEGAEERSLERLQDLPGLLVGHRFRVVEAGRHEGREDPRTSLVGVVREGCVVGGHLAGLQIPDAAPTHDAPHLELRRGLGELPPGEERFRRCAVTGR